VLKLHLISSITLTCISSDSDNGQGKALPAPNRICLFLLKYLHV